MNRDLKNYRVSYERDELTLENTSTDPFLQFDHWFKEVEKEGSIREPNAMSLSTLGLDGFVKSRIVLLKQYDTKGFRFYTNYNSEKGKGIEHHSKVGLSFFWANLERQVIIKGIASKMSRTDSENYFKSRPIDSQLGALVSNQSQVIPDRTYLEERMTALKATYKEDTIPMPEHWGGYCIEPLSIEFWQGRPNRLHDRIQYRLEDTIWIKERLAP